MNRKTIYISKEAEEEIHELRVKERRSFATMCEILILQALKERKRKRKDGKDNNT